MIALNILIIIVYNDITLINYNYSAVRKALNVASAFGGSKSSAPGPSTCPADGRAGLVLSSLELRLVWPPGVEKWGYPWCEIQEILGKKETWCSVWLGFPWEHLRGASREVRDLEIALGKALGSIKWSKLLIFLRKYNFSRVCYFLSAIYLNFHTLGCTLQSVLAKVEQGQTGLPTVASLARPRGK